MNFQNHTLIYIFVCKHAWNLKDKALFSIEWDACCPMFWLKKRAQKGKEETKRHGIISMQQPYWTTSPTHKSISSPSWLLYCHRLCKISLQCWAFMRRVSYNWILTPAVNLCQFTPACKLAAKTQCIATCMQHYKEYAILFSRGFSPGGGIMFIFKIQTELYSILNRYWKAANLGWDRRIISVVKNTVKKSSWTKYSTQFQNPPGKTPKPQIQG